MKREKMAYDINEMPPIKEAIVLAFQHLFAMFGATILVPILVNAAAGKEVLTIPVALVTSGIGTLIYILCTKGKSPVYLGSSFAFITPIAAAFLKEGISGAMTGVMAVGLIYVIVAIIIKFAGKAWLEKLLPPIVIGPMIMIIGLGLAPSAISQIGLADGTAVDWKILVVALVSFLVTAIVMTRAKGFFKIIPFLVGIVTGYIVACILGVVDFKPVAEASFFSLPKFVIPFKDYSLSFTALVTIAPVALVTLCEHIGDHTSLSNIIGRDLIKDPGLDRTLLGDGIATFVAGFLGGPANTTYGENTSVVGMTKVASVKVIGLAAIFAIIIGFLGKVTACVSTIPSAVLGGVSLLLYGFIAVNGLKVLIKNQVDFEKSKNVVVASSMLVLGLGGAAISIISGDLSVTISGMSLASIVGILLNLFLKDDKEIAVKIEPVERDFTKKEITKLKESIKDELTVELKEEVLEEIRKELNKSKKKK
ncbi:MAG: uracil-xanthine permease [Bacilli bacterium]|nr:uracil-xanthine permease [Bacilli bacterium]